MLYHLSNKNFLFSFLFFLFPFPVLMFIQFLLIKTTINLLSHTKDLQSISLVYCDINDYTDLIRSRGKNQFNTSQTNTPRKQTESKHISKHTSLNNQTIPATSHPNVFTLIIYTIICLISLCP